MRALAMTLAISALATGCTRYEVQFEDTVSAEGVWFVDSAVPRGDFIYDGSAREEVFTIRGASWGRGGGKNKASIREDDNAYSVEVMGDVLFATGETGYNKAGVDFDITGPGAVDVTAYTGSGRVELYNVNGVHYATASEIFGRGIEGDVDFYADFNGVDVEIFPYADGIINIVSDGDDVHLALPWGLEYNIQVFADPDYGVEVAELGYDTLYIDPGFVSAQTGRATIQVLVDMTGGTFFLHEAF